MTRENDNKINHLLKAAPQNAVLTSTWLKEQGVSEKLAWWYVQSGWLKRIDSGAYCFANSNITWASAILALQQQLHRSVYPGGKTALQLLGKSHYLTMSLQTIHLFAPPKTKPPRWLNSSAWDEEFKLHCPRLFSEATSKWLVSSEIEGHTLQLSSPELAAIELCYQVPNEVTFSEAALIMEGLSRMRPMLLQDLLESCQSYKVKRLVLFFADYFQHSWLQEIDFKKIDLGKGKRVIAGGGQYNDKYKISVPKLESNE